MLVIRYGKPTCTKTFGYKCAVGQSSRFASVPQRLSTVPPQACIDMAGSAEKCLSVLTAFCTDDSFKEAKTRVAKWNVLGGYLKGCFKDMMEKVGEVIPKTLDDMMGNTLKWLVIGGPGTNNRFGITFSPECLHLVSQAADWLVENLLSDVADLILNDRSTTLDEGIAQNMTFTLSHAYQAAALLSAHSGQTVGTTDLAVREDLEVGAVARWAVADARWSDRLKKAPDVGEYFLDSLDEIIRDRAEETVVDSNDDDDDDL